MSHTEQDAGAANPLDPFGYWKAVRDGGVESWSRTMLDFVNSDAYARASAQWLDTYLAASQQFQQVVDQAMTQTLSQCNIPSTADIGRLSERLWNIELRLDDLDARLNEMLGLLKGMAEAATTTRPTDAQGEPKAARTNGKADREPLRAPEPAPGAAPEDARASAEARPTAARHSPAGEPAAAPAEAKDTGGTRRGSSRRGNGGGRAAPERQEHK